MHPKRQYCTPHMVHKGKAEQLNEIKDRSGNESWYQELLFRNPTLLPIDEIDWSCSPLVPLARELVTAAGSVDLVYISPQGFLTLVETKLFRNHEARREVVVQLLDYAQSMSGWTYERLREEVAKRNPLRPDEVPDEDQPESVRTDPIMARVCDDPEFDEARFVDTVTRNLARGRFLLLVVGDGIQEGAEHLVNTLARTPGLGFTLAAVELKLFEHGESGEKEESFFVQPRVLMRTREVVRAVVELRAPLTSEQVPVSGPVSEPKSGKSASPSLSEQAFMERLEIKLGPKVYEQFTSFLSKCEDQGVYVKSESKSLSLMWTTTRDKKSYHFVLAQIYDDANSWKVELYFVLKYFKKYKIDLQIGLDYAEAVAKIVPNAKIREKLGVPNPWVKVKRNAKDIPLSDFMEKADEWIAAIKTFIERTEEEVKEYTD